MKIRMPSVTSVISVAVAVAAVGVFVPADASAKFDAFQRLQTAQSALKFADSMYMFANDCTYFVSQALWDGGMKPTPEWTPKTSDPSKLAAHNPVYNPGPSKAAAAADHFKNFMVNSGRAVIREIRWSDNSASGAELADVIAYDWDGPANGVIDHLAMVTAFTNDHRPLVSQHSPTRVNRYWSWDVGGNNWIEFTHKGSRVYLIHFI